MAAMTYRSSVARALWVLPLIVALPSCQAESVAPVKPMAHPVTTKNTMNQSDTGHKAHYLMGKFDPASSSLFVRIPAQYADRSGMYLRKEALEAFIKMYEAAKRDGIHLQIRSATRNFSYQKGIWERKWTGKRVLSDGPNARQIKDPVKRALRILEYSAMPGTSRHHWGTDIDLNAFNNQWFESGKGLKLFQWLNTHAARFGFCRPYTANRPTGYKEEKWHWSYIPLAGPMLQAVPIALHDENIQGFAGSEVAPRIDVVKNYVLGVNPECQ